MIDITHKSSTLRRAVAQAVVSVSSTQTLEAVQNGTVPKGDVLSMAKAACLFAVKRTADMIPDCHPMPIEYTGVNFSFGSNQIRIEVEVKTVYKTGVEVEAMHGASVAALTVYDMLKPIDKGIEIGQIKLLEKSGGKSDFTDTYANQLTAAVIICSDVVKQGKKPNKAGAAIRSRLEKHGVKLTSELVLDESPALLTDAFQNCLNEEVNLIIVSGSTGLGRRDMVPETLLPLIDREIPGIAEAIRNYGQQRSPYAMLSRGFAASAGKTLVLAIPGSSRGAEESMDGVFPAVLHFFKNK